MKRLLTALLLLLCRYTVAQKVDIPPPPTDGVFDPAGILTDQQREDLALRMQESGASIPISGKEVEVQMAVVVVDRLDMKLYPRNMQEDEAAEQLARSFHDAWGVGHETESGGTGVLFFLSIYDRVVYISRGGALDRVLNNGRIDDILHQIRPTMRRAKFAEGLMLAIDEAVVYIEKGEPTWKETIMGFFQIQNAFIFVWVGILITALTSAYRQRREERIYAQAASQLSEIDRAQAEALQGQYEATSCPICLESFKSSTVGSDDQPIKLLRCGHVFDESCWSEWVSSGRGNVTKCPICKIDIGGPLEGSSSQSENGASPTSLQEAPNDDVRADDQVFLRRFQQERNFRLVRLGRRYPRYITQSHIQRWSSSTYDGSLARDPIFRRRSPQEVARKSNLHRRRRTGEGVGSSSRGMSFGGGRSSGGRAGRF
jgi:uncharacterized membrane protein YgcG